MPHITVDLLNTDKVKAIITILRDLLNDPLLPEALLKEYGTKLEDITNENINNRL